MPDPVPDPAFVTPATLEEALAALARPGAVVVAGGTWVMRAPLRREGRADVMVSLAGLPGLAAVRATAATVAIGAMATHQALAALPDDPDLRGLRTAAGAAANPGVRRLATVGGNLCAADFAAGDLVPALLALGAEVTVAAPAGESGMDLPAFLSWREAPGPWLLTGIRAAREPARRSAHARLPMRKAGDYPCAILSLSLVPTGGRIRAPRIAIGAVEGTARRWTALETLLEGARLDPAGAEAAARKLTGELSPREGPDAPGWYRLSVLPVLVRRALEDLGGREWS